MQGPVRGHPDTLWCLVTRVSNVPAFIPATDLNPLPQAEHGGFVVQMQVVQIKTTKITFDF